MGTVMEHEAAPSSHRRVQYSQSSYERPAGVPSGGFPLASPYATDSQSAACFHQSQMTAGSEAAGVPTLIGRSGQRPHTQGLTAYNCGGYGTVTSVPQSTPMQAWANNYDSSLHKGRNRGEATDGPRFFKTSAGQGNGV